MITLLLLAALHATPSPTVNDEPYMHAQARVDIGDGRHLNLYCIGSGSPAVIFDSGLGVGSGTLPWSRVQPAVAQFTRACSYDRAGYGFSDPGPLPRTSDAVVSDLHALLVRAGIPPPYILVAHSIAGLYEPLFADRYPADVAGMVLVDPSAPGQAELFSSQYPKYATYEQQQLDKLHECADDPAQKQCQEPPDPHLSAALNAVIHAMERVPTAWADPASELESFGEDGAQVNSAAHGYGAMPLIVLTSTQAQQAMQTAMGASKAQVAVAQSGWISLHDQLAAQSSRGVNCVIEGVGHFIQIDKPNVIIEAIRQVIRVVPIEEKPSCAAWPSPKPTPTPP
ncbi:MAG TPA: alpha/beta hydrolase [Verrucomicrobiae bacterium]|nr:alpha/beta hydrolase [Verrucomicrobiae bacterium]